MYDKNIAVIGTGYWGKNLVRNFYNLGALHTICDTNPEAVKSFLEQYKDISGVTAFSETINNPDIKGIAISTPAVTHATLAREAILAGKDIYFKKPLCLSDDEGTELNELARRNGRIRHTTG